MIDIIIPILNEEKFLTKETNYYRSLKQLARVIFVDGGSTDQTVAVAKEFGEVVTSPTGRAIQKNHGIQYTKAEHILFLHVDTLIDGIALDRIDQALKKGAVGGCLTMRIRDKGFIFRIYEKMVNVRASAFGIIDGDLGMFVQKDIFEQLGGFAPTPVMEDIIFSKRLRKTGSLVALQEPIYVSSRKWHERGFGKTFLEYTKAYVLLWTGYLKIESVKKRVI